MKTIEAKLGDFPYLITINKINAGKKECLRILSSHSSHSYKFKNFQQLIFNRQDEILDIRQSIVDEDDWSSPLFLKNLTGLRLFNGKNV